MSYKSYLKKLPIIGNKIKTPKVSVLRLSGIIADGGMRKATLSIEKLQKSIDKAFDVFETKAVCLIINSPGGSPAQSALIADYIRHKAEQKDVPVFAFVEDVAASGGYWLACAADEIYATHVSIVGSIGVISASFGLEEFISEYKINRRVHTSGKDKSFLDPFQPEQAKDIKRLKDTQKDLHDHFIDWVKQRRGDKLKGTDTKIFEGAFWTAGPAKDLGLIDGTSNVYEFIHEKFGEKTNLIDITPDKGFIQGLMSARASIANDVIDTLESKAVWQRYGL